MNLICRYNVCVCDVKVSISVTSRLVLSVQTEIKKDKSPIVIHQDERFLALEFVLMPSLSKMLPCPWLPCCIPPLPDVLAGYLRLRPWCVVVKQRAAGQRMRPNTTSDGSSVVDQEVRAVGTSHARVASPHICRGAGRVDCLSV
jgi:hypothetical protein